MIFYNDCQFKYQEKEHVINLTDFSPRSNGALESFIKEHSGKQIFYLQKPKEGFNFGAIYSLLLYTPAVKFQLRNGRLPEGLALEEGRAIHRMDDVKELAIRNNINNVIFHPDMVGQFNTNTDLIEKSGFCFQVLDGDHVIGHTSVVKVPDSTFGNREIYVLMRFIVDQPYRKTGVKEVLMAKIAERLSENSPLYLQVFPNNEVAIKFFLRRLNVFHFYEKWRI